MYAPQIEPITNITRNHKAILGKLKDGPVFLTQHGMEAAVLVSATEWRSMVQRMEAFEAESRAARLSRSLQAYHAMINDPTQRVSMQEYDRMLTEEGLVG